MDAVLSTLVKILEFVVAFGLLVFLHELGHYLMAKLFNIQVEEFGFGFPPRLVKLFQFRETEFTLNWIPLAHLCARAARMTRRSPAGWRPPHPWARLAVLFGGPLMNLITGIVLFSLIYTQVGAPDTRRVLIVDVNQGSPAAAAGIQKDDIVTRINGEPVNSTNDLSQVVRANLGKEVHLTLLRGNETVETTAVPRENPPEGQGALGITMSNPVQQINWFQSLPLATQVAYEQGRHAADAALHDAQRADLARTGPAGRPQGHLRYLPGRPRARRRRDSTGQQPQGPFGLNTLGILATISIALGFTNLLPIPALDGGRILFVLPEILFRGASRRSMRI